MKNEGTMFIIIICTLYILIAAGISYVKKSSFDFMKVTYNGIELSFGVGAVTSYMKAGILKYFKKDIDVFGYDKKDIFYFILLGLARVVHSTVWPLIKLLFS